jgi:uncharacterized protein (TIGR03083 family)
VPHSAADTALVDALDEVWSSIDAFAAELTESEWKTPTECPGWSVQDNVAHIIGIESVLLGREAPSGGNVDAPHVKNDIGRSNEIWVDAYRNRSGATVLAEFRAVTHERLAALRDPALDFGADAWTPVGPGTVRDLLPFRVFDSWIHEQDMRRAVGRPGGWDGPAAVLALDRIAAVMPMIVGKRAQAPDGTTVVFDVTGPAGRVLVIGVEGGRAKVQERTDGEPTVRLRLDGETWVRLSSGRGTVDAILASGTVSFTGDTHLGDTIVRQMNFLF